MSEIVMVPVGVVVGGRVEPIDDDWGRVETQIVIDDRFATDVLAGLDGFSHIDVVFHFDQVDESRIHLGARHPRNRDACARHQAARGRIQAADNGRQPGWMSELKSGYW
jgi:tRNA (Thr-GGU) A37 N-methylase